MATKHEAFSRTEEANPVFTYDGSVYTNHATVTAQG